MATTPTRAFCGMERLPSELILHIASFSDPISLGQWRLCAARFAEVLTEADLYARHFREARIRMYERTKTKDLEPRAAEQDSITAFGRVLSKLHPRLIRHLHEVTFLLGLHIDATSLQELQSALRTAFVLLASRCGSGFQLRITRGGQTQAQDARRTETSITLPDVVFQELFTAFKSGDLCIHSLLINLETSIAHTCLKTSRDALAAVQPGLGLRALKGFHLNVYAPEASTGKKPYRDQLYGSLEVIHHYADIISLLSDLEGLIIVWTPRNDDAQKWSVSVEIEKFALNRVLQNSTLPYLRALHLSGSTWFDCWCTSDAIQRFLHGSPLLETLVMSNIVLRGSWNAIFDYIYEREPKLEEYTLQHLCFWLPIRSDAAQDSNIYQVRFINRGRSQTSFFSRKAHVPLNYRAELAWEAPNRVHYWQDLTEFVTSTEISDDTVASLLDHYEKVWKPNG